MAGRSARKSDKRPSGNWRLMKITIETDNPDEAQQMISSAHFSADLEDFNQYLRRLLKSSDEDIETVEKIHGVFWDVLGKYLE
jgi:hypothetical protein